MGNNYIRRSGEDKGSKLWAMLEKKSIQGSECFVNFLTDEGETRSNRDINTLVIICCKNWLTLRKYYNYFLFVGVDTCFDQVFAWWNSGFGNMLLRRNIIHVNCLRSIFYLASNLIRLLFLLFSAGSTNTYIVLISYHILNITI